MDETELGTILDNVINPEAALINVTIDRMWMLLGEIDDILNDYGRDLAINFISSNFSVSKHMCQTLCRGKFDKEIMAILEDLRTFLREDIDRRKGKKN